MFVPIKAKDPFLIIRLKMGPTINLEVRNESAVAIVKRRLPLHPKEGSPLPPHHQKGKWECVKTPSSTATSPKDPKGRLR